MGNHISNLPLQDMIAGVVRSATEKLAADEEAEKKVKDEMREDYDSESDEDEEKDSCATKTAKWTDPKYVEKLASACDFISQNVDNISTPNRGVLGNALAKMAQEAGMPPDAGVPVPPVNPSGALLATASMEGEQKYKDQKPLEGYDAAAPQVDTPETSAGMPAGKTQIMNNMESAPGQGSGSVPKAEYPTDGPLHSGPTKTAAQIAREKILRKLAGEDVMESSISSPKSGGPLVGEGEMEAYEAQQVPSCPTDGSGYGNEARSGIASNQAAIDETKKDAKKVQVPQLAELLENPAFSPAHDNKLQEQLRNTGEAGVKIAGAKARAIVKRAAADGRITQETVNRFVKTAKLTKKASPGCSCGGSGSCKVCKLNSLKEKDSMGDSSGGMNAPGAGGGGGMGL